MELLIIKRGKDTFGRCGPFGNVNLISSAIISILLSYNK